MLNHQIIKEFGKKIRYLRNEHKLSQEELSFKTGFHRTYIGMVERGERNISLSNIAVFAKVFEISVSELLNLKEINPNHSCGDYELKKEK